MSSRTPTTNSSSPVTPSSGTSVTSPVVLLVITKTPVGSSLKLLMSRTTSESVSFSRSVECVLKVTGVPSVVVRSLTGARKGRSLIVSSIISTSKVCVSVVPLASVAVTVMSLYPVKLSWAYRRSVALVKSWNTSAYSIVIGCTGRSDDSVSTCMMWFIRS